MFIRDLGPQGKTKIKRINKLLSEQFGITIKSSFPSKKRIEKIIEMTDMAIVKLKDNNKQFQLQPEYAKYLGIKDIMTTMIAESMYAESPANMRMKQMLVANVQKLMDGGCTVDEAISQCANDFRKDSRYAHDDEYVLPIIIKAAKDYYESSCNSNESLEEIAFEGPSTELNEYLLKELAKEIGLDLKTAENYDAIEEKLNLFAEVSGKSRDSVVGFLNGLEEDAVANGIKFFGAKIAEAKFQEAVQYVHKLKADGKSDQEIADEVFDGDVGAVKDVLKKGKKDESMFDDIINELLAEELEGTSVEEAEVVMAVRALADDIQDHVERLGRMVNEDIPAIADQMIHEFGADKASQFKDQAEQTLSTALESAKAAKDGVNQLVGSITGEDMGLSGGDNLGDIEDPIGADSPIDDLEAPADFEEPAMDVNEPAAAGPEEEPLGRAPIEV